MESKKTNPYSQLSYLEFTAIPSLFYQYLDILVADHDLPTIRNLFQSFMLTMLELVGHAYYQTQYLKNWITNWNEVSITALIASPLTHQLFQFLKAITFRMPIGQITLLPSFTYNYLHPKIPLQKIALDQCISERQRQFSQSNNFQHNIDIAYLESIKGFTSAQQLIYKITQNQKITQQQKQLTLAITKYQQNSPTLYSAPSHQYAYRQYLQNYKQILDKLTYVMEDRSDQFQNDSNKQENNNYHPIVISLIGKELEFDDRVHSLYVECEGVGAKDRFIRGMFRNMFKMCHFSEYYLGQLELVVVYHKDVVLGEENLEDKVQCFMYLLALKIIKNSDINILGDLQSICSIKSPQSQTFTIVAQALISVYQSQPNSVTHKKTGLLKIMTELCTKNTKAPTSKFSLILSALTVLSFRLNCVDTYRDIVFNRVFGSEFLDGISSVSVIDYMISFLWMFKRRLFHMGMDQEFWVNSLVWAMDFDGCLRKIIQIKFTNGTTQLTKQPELQMLSSSSQVLSRLQKLFTRRQQINNNLKSQIYLIILNFISIGLQPNHPSCQQQLNLESLKYLIQMMNKLQLLINNSNIASYLSPPSLNNQDQKLYSMLYYILYWNLCACGYYLEALVCLEVGQLNKKSYKFSYMLAEKHIRSNQWYYRRVLFEEGDGDGDGFQYCEGLLGCLSKFDFFQIFMEVFANEKIYALAENWLSRNNQQNYQNITQSRKDKRNYIKRHKYHNMLWKKFIK